MPNLTISITDEMKAEMDKYTEVSWSEVCREAINRYLRMRQNPTPNIELGIDETSPQIHWDFGVPGLVFKTIIINKMGFEIIVDRILFKARFETPSGRSPAAGSDADLVKHIILANTTGRVDAFLGMAIDKIFELDKDISSTFTCITSFTVFIEGFKNPYHQEVRTRIPIDEWKELVKKVSRQSRSG